MASVVFSASSQLRLELCPDVFCASARLDRGDAGRAARFDRDASFCSASRQWLDVSLRCCAACRRLRCLLSGRRTPFGVDWRSASAVPDPCVSRPSSASPILCSSAQLRWLRDLAFSGVAPPCWVACSASFLPGLLTASCGVVGCTRWPPLLRVVDAYLPITNSSTSPVVIVPIDTAIPSLVETGPAGRIQPMPAASVVPASSASAVSAAIPAGRGRFIVILSSIGAYSHSWSVVFFPAVQVAFAPSRMCLRIRMACRSRAFSAVVFVLGLGAAATSDRGRDADRSRCSGTRWLCCVLPLRSRSCL